MRLTPIRCPRRWWCTSPRRPTACGRRSTPACPRKGRRPSSCAVPRAVGWQPRSLRAPLRRRAHRGEDRPEPRGRSAGAGQDDRAGGRLGRRRAHHHQRLEGAPAGGEGEARVEGSAAAHRPGLRRRHGERHQDDRAVHRGLLVGPRAAGEGGLPAPLHAHRPARGRRGWLRDAQGDVHRGGAHGDRRRLREGPRAGGRALGDHALWHARRCRPSRRGSRTSPRCPPGPFTVVVPIAARYEELARAMTLAFTDGKLFFSSTYKELYLSKPEVYASQSDQLVVKLHLAGPIKAGSLSANLDGDLYFAGPPGGGGQRAAHPRSRADGGDEQLPARAQGEPRSRRHPQPGAGGAQAGSRGALRRGAREALEGRRLRRRPRLPARERGEDRSERGVPARLVPARLRHHHRAGGHLHSVPCRPCGGTLSFCISCFTSGRWRGSLRPAPRKARRRR